MINPFGNTIEITKDNIGILPLDEIRAFSWADRDADGEPGGVWILTYDGRVYHTNHANEEFKRKEMTRKKLFNGSRVWSMMKMGHSNFLYFREEDEQLLQCKRRESLKTAGTLLYDIWLQWFKE